MLEKLPHAIGRALKDKRPGLETTLHETAAKEAPDLITVESSAFLHEGPIPAKYTEDGPGLSPPLKWTGVTRDTAAVMVVVEDADSPTSKPIVHLLAYDEPGRDGAWAEGQVKSPAGEGAGHAVGRNSFHRDGWLPPDPPPGHGVHRYVFQVFALRHAAGLDKDHPAKKDVAEALADNVLAKGVLIGTYERT